MSQLALLGYYGQGNFGDELFVRVAQDHAARLWPDLEYPEALPADGFVHSGRLGKSMGHLLTAARSQKLVLAGGSTLQKALGVWQIHSTLARSRYRSYEALGVSYGPFACSADRLRVRRFARRFERLVVRDRPSVERAREDGLDPLLGGDLAALAFTRATGSSMNASSTPEKLLRLTRPLRLGVSPVTGVSTHDDWFRVIANCLRGLREDGHDDVEVQLFALQDGNVRSDVSLCQNITSELKRANFSVREAHVFGTSVGETIQRLDHVDMMLAGRLHAGIAAYLSGKPIAMVEYHPKSKDFADDIGLPFHARMTLDGNMADRYARPSLATMSPSEYTARAIGAYYPTTGTL